MRWPTTPLAPRLLAGLFAFALAEAGAAQGLLECRDGAGRTFVTPAPCPPGSTYLGRHTEEPQAAPGGEASPPSEALDPADAARVARALRAARFTRALSSLHTLRIYALMHFEESGAWATEPSQLGLDGSTLSNADIAGVTFHEDGTIEARLRPEFGDDRRIWLQPSLTLGGAETSWACRTNLRVPKQPGFAPRCEAISTD